VGLETVGHAGGAQTCVLQSCVLDVVPEQLPPLLSGVVLVRVHVCVPVLHVSEHTPHV
jgi:hypothetical protein